jgi:hypothetical protein
MFSPERCNREPVTGRPLRFLGDYFSGRFVACSIDLGEDTIVKGLHPTQLPAAAPERRCISLLRRMRNRLFLIRGRITRLPELSK